jgi:Flp pilus assembly protein TadG
MMDEKGTTIRKSAQQGGAPAQKGQATVEFALVLIILVALIYGILEVSRLFFINAEVENAAREASHYAALHPGVDGTYLRDNVVGPKLTLIDKNSSDLVVSDPCFLKASSCSDRAGVGPFYPVKVTVSYTWRSFVNIVPDMSTLTLKPLGPLTLSAESTSLIEGR